MNAAELIEHVEECRRERWQNSDISSGGERLLELVAAHFQECEECRKAFDTEEYEEETLIGIWHRYMCQNEDPAEWICDEGLQAIFDHPIGVFVIVPAQEGTVGYPEFKIELSEPALHTEIGKRWPEAEIDEDFQLCEEPEAAENEMMKNVIQAGEVVARVYTIEED